MYTSLYWYELNTEELKNIKITLFNRFSKRYNLLRLLSFTNTLFLSQFSELFNVNNSELCDIIYNSNIFRINKLSAQGKAGIVYKLTTKNYSVILKSLPTSRPNYLEIKLMNCDNNHKIMNPSNKYYSIYNQYKQAKIAVIKCDNNFINQTIMHTILNIILKLSPYYLYQYDAYWCNNIGYNITELASEGDMHDYLNRSSFYPSDENLKYPLYCILSTLAILKQEKYSFVHADLKAKNVFVGIENNVIVFKIADFDKSSITYNGFRFYNSKNEYLLSYDATTVNQGYYIPSSNILPLELYIMNSPYGYFMTYDIYTLFISLLAIPKIWLLFEHDLYNYINHSGIYSYSILFNAFAYMFNKFDLLTLYDSLNKDTRWAKMSSIHEINKLINQNHFSLRYDLYFIYNLFGVTPLKRTDGYLINIMETTEGQYCLNQCNGTCITPKYNYFGIDYNWDYC